MRAPGWFAAGRLLLALGAVACGEVDAGSTRFVGAVRFEDPSRSYALSLLQPPWIAVSVAGQSYFLVPSSDATITTDATQALAKAIYTLDIGTSAGAPTEAMAALKAGMPQVGTVGAGALVTASGATGVEASWQETAALFHRDAFVAGARTSTFRLHFSGPHGLADDRMLTQMILSFEPR